MDKTEFFHQATLRICGNLEIEVAMQILLHFLKGFMPISEMYLQHFDQEYHAIRSIAHACETGCQKLDLLSPLSKNAGHMADNAPADQDAFLFTDPNSFPVTKEMTDFHGRLPASVIILLLRTQSAMLGFCVLISHEDVAFTEEQLAWVLMLKEPMVIAMANALKHREVLKLNDILADDNRYLHGELRRLSGDDIVGADFGLKHVMHQARQVAPMDSPVLLLGETGTGKDVIANTIHFASSRSKGPFVSVNCGAIPDTLIDSELFGHEKGAFTGALAQKRGRFERADNGTIFLDEIGELPAAAQVRLLRVLQTNEIERVGGVKTIPLNIRVIAATNRNLEQMVTEQTFREDLWFRLNVFPIHLPPLRQRRMDIPALVQYFINLKSKELKLPTIPALKPGAIEPLMGYHWPGNVRELQNIIERALIINPSGPLTFDYLTTGKSGLHQQAGAHEAEPDNLDQMIGRHIRHILIKTEGKVNGPHGAAALLGVNPSTLRNRMKKLGIDYGRKLSE